VFSAEHKNQSRLLSLLNKTSGYSSASKLARANAEPVMCDHCIELDRKIAQFQTLAERVLDPLTVEGLRKLIEEMQAQKAALHPELQK
jgi:hypothetical protein